MYIKYPFFGSRIYLITPHIIIFKKTPSLLTTIYYLFNAAFIVNEIITLLPLSFAVRG